MVVLQSREYLIDLLTRYEPSYRLRSVSSEDTVDDLKLYIPKFNYDEVPYDIRCIEKVDDFKGQLKTFLFKHAYNLN